MSRLPPSRFFPPAEEADAEGLIGFGGRLTVPWLLDAYAHGIFPWPMGDLDNPMPWWSPDPRAVIPLDAFHVPRRLRRTIRQGASRVTRDRAFEQVIAGCATAEDRRGGTWLTPRMIEAYVRLHHEGIAHSVETWHDDHLAGGVYGVSLGGLFAGESMFHHERDASKVALVHLVDHLRARGYRLFDIQQLTPHTARFGAIEIPRDEYLRRLAEALPLPITWDD